MNESCHTYEWVTSHIWMSHVTHMNESCHTYEWDSPHIWILITIVSNQTYEWIRYWVMSHIWKSHEESIKSQQLRLRLESQLRCDLWHLQLTHVVCQVSTSETETWHTTCLSCKCLSCAFYTHICLHMPTCVTCVLLFANICKHVWHVSVAHDFKHLQLRHVSDVCTQCLHICLQLSHLKTKKWNWDTFANMSQLHSVAHVQLHMCTCATVVALGYMCNCSCTRLHMCSCNCSCTQCSVTAHVYPSATAHV